MPPHAPLMFGGWDGSGCQSGRQGTRAARGPQSPELALPRSMSRAGRGASPCSELGCVASHRAAGMFLWTGNKGGTVPPPTGKRARVRGSSRAAGPGGEQRGLAGVSQASSGFRGSGFSHTKWEVEQTLHQQQQGVRAFLSSKKPAQIVLQLAPLKSLACSWQSAGPGQAMRVSHVAP